MSSPTTLCRHVYENTGFALCPECGKPTHEVDWAKEEAMRQQWLKENPDAGKYGGWWSI